MQYICTKGSGLLIQKYYIIMKGKECIVTISCSDEGAIQEVINVGGHRIPTDPRE